MAPSARMMARFLDTVRMPRVTWQKAMTTGWGNRSQSEGAIAVESKLAVTAQEMLALTVQ
tara:strand:- start:90 stop:269 length:180 start_codon:yes stop_codon:yes gene_type:complete